MHNQKPEEEKQKLPFDMKREFMDKWEKILEDVEKQIIALAPDQAFHVPQSYNQQLSKERRKNQLTSHLMAALLSQVLAPQKQARAFQDQKNPAD